MNNFKKPTTFGRKKFGARSSSFGPARAGGRSFTGRDERPIELHEATCNECGKKCEVPFRPNGKKPIYCRDCFKANEPEQAPAYGRPSFRSSEPAGSDDMKKQLSILNSKLDKLISVIEEQTRAISKAN